MDHQTFRTQAEQGNILVRIDPVVARWFFTDTGGSAVQRQINEPIPVERTIVKALFIVAPIALFVSFYLAVRAFGWWSLAVIPLSVLVWFVENGAASVESVRVLWPTVVMIGLIFAFIYDPSYLCQWWNGGRSVNVL